MPDAARLDIERQAIALFDELVDIPETQRESWISARTANQGVKDRLAAMLEADRVSALSGMALGTGAAALLGAEASVLPERIGSYRITGLIGRGGMGAVYRGQRDTGDFTHEAAIKLIKPGLLSDVLVQRFLSERQTLAALRHPNIARLYDGGATAEGSPYIVMELIDGQPIDRWADAHALATAPRARLIETAARAVAYAHSRLVVHRDLTPLNMLVEPDGTLKLIDFGIAKPAEPEAAPGSTDIVATDIAALCRLLRRLVPTPPPELAAIAQHPYPTAQALADDLQAWREGNPVSAFASGEVYRLRKFAARNRVAVSIAAIALVGLVGALVAVLLANAQARRAEAEAEARFQQTRAIAKSMLFDVYDKVSRVTGATQAREALAETSIHYLDALAAMENAPADVTLEAGRGYVRLAEVTGGGQHATLGRYADANALLARAATLLEPAYRANPQEKATALAFAALRLEQAGTDLYNNNQPDRGRQHAAEAEKATAPFATTDAEAARQHAAAIQSQGDSFGWNDDYARALPQHQRAENFLAGLPPAIAADPTVRAVRSANLRLLGESQHKLKQPAAARATLDQAIAVNRTLLATAPDDPATQRKLAVSLWYAAVVHRTNNRDAEAQKAITEAITIARQMAARDPNDTGAAQLVTLAGEVMAQIHADRGEKAQSLAVSQEVLKTHQKLVAAAGNTPGALRSYTSALRTTAGNMYNLNNIPQACTLWKQALTNYKTLESQKALTPLDRNNALPETQAYVRDVCDGGKPPREWPARPL